MAHILFIDDDELMRLTAVQMLELDGHEVVEAASGAEALEQFARRSGRFDLVITDVLMPGLDGAQVASRLRAQAPQLPIVAISGGRRLLTPQFNLRSAELAGATLQLAKPFTRQQLRETVAAAIAAVG